MIFLTADDVINIHDVILSQYKGSSGIRDIGLLESAVGRVSQGYYEDIYSSAAALLQSLCLNHPFVDGNKRTAYASLEYFLSLNGHELSASDHSIETFLIEKVIKEKITIEEIALWISTNSSGG